MPIPKNMKKEEQTNEEIDDLLKEGRLLKKLKKGKINTEEFEKQVGDNSDIVDFDD